MLYEVTDVLSTERILSGTLEAKIQADCQFLQKRNRLPKLYIIQSSEETELGSGKYFYQSHDTVTIGGVTGLWNNICR